MKLAEQVINIFESGDFSRGREELVKKVAEKYLKKKAEAGYHSAKDLNDLWATELFDEFHTHFKEPEMTKLVEEINAKIIAKRKEEFQPLIDKHGADAFFRDERDKNNFLDRPTFSIMNTKEGRKHGTTVNIEFASDYVTGIQMQPDIRKKGVTGIKPDLNKFQKTMKSFIMNLAHTHNKEMDDACDKFREEVMAIWKQEGR